MERKVYCLKCGKSLKEGEQAIRRKGWTGFYCSYKCLCLNLGISEAVIVSRELIKEDEEVTGISWNEE